MSAAYAGRRPIHLTCYLQSCDSRRVATIIAERPPASEAIELVERGLAWGNVEALAEALGITLEKLASLLDIAPATFYRRKRARRLSKHESDRLMRFARLWWLACDVFETE